MESIFDSGHLIDASIAFAAVLIYLATYFGLKFQGGLHVPSRVRLWVLASLSCSFMLIGLVSMTLFLVLRKRIDSQAPAWATLVIWTSCSALSICCVEVLEVLYPMMHAWPKYYKAPFVFWIGLVIQGAFVGLGLWRLAKNRMEILWAVPAVSHVNFAAMAIAALVVGPGVAPAPSWLPWVEAVTGICASTISVGLVWAPHPVTAQCLACIAIVFTKGIRDWLKTHDDLLWDTSMPRTAFKRSNGDVESLKATSPWSTSKAELVSAPMTRPESFPAPSHPPIRSDTAEDHAIVYVQTVQKTITSIPAELSKRPSDREIWVRCFVLVDDLQLFRPTLALLPSTHIVRRTSDDQYFEVAVSEPCVQGLQDIGIPFLVASEAGLQYDVSQSSQGENNIYGILSAKEKAQQQFLQNAVEATLSGAHGKGLDQYYRDHTSNYGLLALISRAFVVRDILESHSNVLRRFLQHLVFIALHSLEHVEDASKLEVMDRNEEAWIAFFRDLCMERTRRPTNAPGAEKQLVSLLQAVLESASDQMELSLQALDLSSSARDNITLLSSLLGCSTGSGPVPFGSIDERRMKSTLRRCKVFEGDEGIDIKGMKEQIRKYVPVGFPDVERRSGHLVHTLWHRAC